MARHAVSTGRARRCPSPPDRTLAIGVVQNPAVPAALRPAGLYLFVARMQALPPMGARMMPYGLGHCERCGIDVCLHILRMGGASAVLCHRCYCDVRDHGAVSV